jgi:hypothetical protein
MIRTGFIFTCQQKAINGNHAYKPLLEYLEFQVKFQEARLLGRDADA